MENALENTLICRVCLKVVEFKAHSFGYIEDANGNLKEMLMCSVPELDIYVSAQPIICLPCIHVLITVYNFKTRCVNTETIIRSYIQRNNLTEYNQVNLTCVVKDLIKMNNYYKELEELKQVATRNSFQNGDVHENELGDSTVSLPVHLPRTSMHPPLERTLLPVPPSPLPLTSVQSIENRMISIPPALPLAPGSIHAPERPLLSVPPPQDPNRLAHPLATPVGPEAPPQISRSSINPHNFPAQLHTIPPPLMSMCPRYTSPPPMSPMSPPHAPLYRLLPQQIAACSAPHHVSVPFQRFSMPSQRFSVSSPVPMRSHCAPSPFQSMSIPPLTSLGQPHFLLSPNEELNSTPTMFVPRNTTPSPAVTLQPASETQNTIQPEENVHSSIEAVSNNISEKDGIKRSLTPSVDNIESSLRLVIKIPRSRITVPNIAKEEEILFDKNEDSSEKENNDMDVDKQPIDQPENHQLASVPIEKNIQKIYRCSNCMYLTTSEQFFIEHRKICHEEINKNRIKCPHCPHITNRSNALSQHINTMHTRAIWYQCEHCPYRSTDKSCLRRHKRKVHIEVAGSAEFVCSICGYICATDYNLSKHMLKHEPNSPLQCEFCSYSTKDRSNFRKHVYIHNPITTDCDFCDYKCVSPYQMKSHLKKYHNGVGLEDIDCKSDQPLMDLVNDISTAIREANYKGPTD